MTDRREANRQFKQLVPAMGIFQVRNRADGRVLVTSAANLPAAMKSLEFQLRNGLYRRHPDLQADVTRLGAENFAFEELDRLEPRSEPGYDPGPDLRALEEMWLEKLKPFGVRGYNRRPEAS